jgi:putative peptidoglycan lipid II flippase
VRQTVPAFYALGDTRTPVIVSAVDLCAFIGLAVTLRGPLGHVGISVAVAGSSAVQMALLLVGLKWRLGTMSAKILARSAARTIAASAVAAAAGLGAARAVALGRPAGGPSAGGVLRAFPGVAALATFTVVFLLAARLMRAPELEEIVGALRGRLGRRKA